MNRIITFIRRAFRVEYRLSVLFVGEGSPRNTYGRDRSLLTGMARHTADCQYWTLYKRGPFFLPERPVDWND